MRLGRWPLGVFIPDLPPVVLIDVLDAHFPLCEPNSVVNHAVDKFFSIDEMHQLPSRFRRGFLSAIRKLCIRDHDQGMVWATGAVAEGGDISGTYIGSRPSVLDLYPDGNFDEWRSIGCCNVYVSIAGPADAADI